MGCWRPGAPRACLCRHADLGRAQNDQGTLSDLSGHSDGVRSQHGNPSLEMAIDRRYLRVFASDAWHDLTLSTTQASGSRIPYALAAV
jgi:hypothetical protein